MATRAVATVRTQWARQGSRSNFLWETTEIGGRVGSQTSVVSASSKSNSLAELVNFILFGPSTAQPPRGRGSAKQNAAAQTLSSSAGSNRVPIAVGESFGLRSPAATSIAPFTVNLHNSTSTYVCFYFYLSISLNVQESYEILCNPPLGAASRRHRSRKCVR